MKYLSNLDLAKNELQNAKVQNLASDPSSPVKGQVYFNSTANKFRVYNGTTWDEMGTSTASGDMSKSVYDPQSKNADAFARSNHTGTQATSTITGLDTALSGKAATNHTHTSSQITDFNASVQTIANSAVAALVGAAPASLDTLKELADALGSDPNFAATVTGQIGSLDTRLDTIEASGGPAKKYSATVGGSTSVTVTHSLGSQDVVTQIRQVSDNAVVECDITNATTNTVTLGFSVAPAANSLRVVCIG